MSLINTQSRELATLLGALEYAGTHHAQVWPNQDNEALRNLLSDSLGSWPLEPNSLQRSKAVASGLVRVALQIVRSVEDRLDAMIASHLDEENWQIANQFTVAKGVLQHRVKRITPVRFVMRYGGGRHATAQARMADGVHTLKPVISAELAPLGPLAAKRLWNASADVAAAIRASTPAR